MSDPGKIGRLPGRIREEVSQRLYDGETETEILPWINALPETTAKAVGKINKDNLSRWRNGPYQDWLANLKESDDVRRVSQLSHQLAKEAGFDISEGFLAVATGRIQTLLQSSEGDDLNQAILSLARLRKAELASKKLNLDKLKLSHDERRLALDEEAHRAKTAELFLKWADTPEAKAILGSQQPYKIKVKSMVKLLWGERPDLGEPAYVTGS